MVGGARHADAGQRPRTPDAKRPFAFEPYRRRVGVLGSAIAEAARRGVEHRVRALADLHDGEPALDGAVGAEAEEAVRAGEALAVFDRAARNPVDAAIT